MVTTATEASTQQGDNGDGCNKFTRLNYTIPDKLRIIETSAAHPARNGLSWHCWWCVPYSRRFEETSPCKQARIISFFNDDKKQWINGPCFTIILYPPFISQSYVWNQQTTGKGTHALTVNGCQTKLQKHRRWKKWSSKKSGIPPSNWVCKRQSAGMNFLTNCMLIDECAFDFDMKLWRVRSTEGTRVIVIRPTTIPNTTSIVGVIAAADMIAVGVKDQLLLRREGGVCNTSSGTATMKTFIIILKFTDRQCVGEILYTMHEVGSFYKYGIYHTK